MTSRWHMAKNEDKLRADLVKAQKAKDKHQVRSATTMLHYLDGAVDRTNVELASDLHTLGMSYVIDWSR